MPIRALGHSMPSGYRARNERSLGVPLASTSIRTALPRWQRYLHSTRPFARKGGRDEIRDQSQCCSCDLRRSRCAGGHRLRSRSRVRGRRRHHCDPARNDGDGARPDAAGADDSPDDPGDDEPPDADDGRDRHSSHDGTHRHASNDDLDPDDHPIGRRQDDDGCVGSRSDDDHERRRSPFGTGRHDHHDSPVRSWRPNPAMPVTRRSSGPAVYARRNGSRLPARAVLQRHASASDRACAAGRRRSLRRVRNRTRLAGALPDRPAHQHRARRLDRSREPVAAAQKGAPARRGQGPERGAPPPPRVRTEALLAPGPGQAGEELGRGIPVASTGSAVAMSVAWAASAATPLRPSGDAELERLYAEYSTKVHGYCRRQLGGRVEAEDATQTVFLHALRALRSGVVPELESAWLFAIAHNVCRTYWRGAARRRRSEDQRDPHVLEEVVAQRETDHDELFGLGDALSRIPETQRRAILLREWHGLSYREIAEKLETSAAAVEMLLFRARRSLAAELRGERPNLRAKALGGLGDLLTSLKLLFGGSSAALKIVAGVAAVAALTAGSEALRHREV